MCGQIELHPYNAQEHLVKYCHEVAICIKIVNCVFKMMNFVFKMMML